MNRWMDAAGWCFTALLGAAGAYAMWKILIEPWFVGGP